MSYFCKKNGMKRILVLLCLILVSCDDGDIIYTNFNFSEETKLNICQDNNDYVLHYIDQETAEAVSFRFTSADFQLSYTGFEAPDDLTIDLNSSNKINYRRLSSATNTNDYFCQNVPPSIPQVIEEFESTTGGYATISVVAYDQDDNDGVPAAMEDINNNGNLFDDDTDNDGIPNFLDVDDDNDNVLTEVEIINEENPDVYPDFDGDGIPNYLDPDDDGDGVITRYEDINAYDSGNEDPILNPTDDTNAEGVPNYLNPNVKESLVIDQYKPNVVTRKFRVQIVIHDVSLENINNEQTVTLSTLNLGKIETTKEEDLASDNSED